MEDPDHKIVHGFRVKKGKKTELEKRLTLEEADRLVASITMETHKNYWRRNRALVVLLLNTGLRVGELAGLKVSDVVTVQGKIKVMLFVRPEIAKRKKPRHIPLNNTAQAAVKDLLDPEHRPEPGFDDALIVTPRGRRLSVRMIQHVVTLAALKAGIERLVGPHGLRHTCLSRVYEKTTNIKLVQTLAGHTKSKTTIDLYTHATLDGLTEAMKVLEEPESEATTDAESAEQRRSS